MGCDVFCPFLTQTITKNSKNERFTFPITCQILSKKIQVDSTVCIVYLIDQIRELQRIINGY